MEKSNHKNYIENFDRDRPKLTKNIIIPNGRTIFNLFNQKFSADADADIKRWRSQLWKLWYSCSDSCSQIHRILSWEAKIDDKYKDIVKNIVNLDYESLKEVFHEIQNEYFNNWANDEIVNYLQDICKYLDKMRKISKAHTNIISKK